MWITTTRYSSSARLAVDALYEVMGRRWRQAGKNTDGRPGLAWDMGLYVPLVVLLLVKNLNSRDMESYLAEHVVARVFMGRRTIPGRRFGTMPTLPGRMWPLAKTVWTRSMR